MTGRVVQGGPAGEVREPPRRRSPRHARHSAGIEQPTMERLTEHWPEYLIEACCLGLFMVMAVAVATLLEHPSSPIAGWSADPLIRRIPMGLAMGLTAAALIYSPMGQRSGAHMNPAVTLTFLRLGRIAPLDAAAYIVAQFAGGVGGMLVAVRLLRELPSHASVNYVATVPGPLGAAAAFSAEVAIACALMGTVLGMTSRPALSRYTGAGVSVLLTVYIVFEAPLSGMSLNPARTLASNVLAGEWSSLWVYFLAPTLGMLIAGERHRRRHAAAAGCAKLHHPRRGRCIFGCGHRETSSWARATATTSSSSAPAPAAARWRTIWPHRASASSCSSAVISCRARRTTGARGR
jgi:aquaporin Z